MGRGIWTFVERNQVMQNDSVLYNEFLAGNTSSFDELMVRYGDNLMYYLYGYVHNLEDAEDLMIEALLKKEYDRFK